MTIILSIESVLIAQEFTDQFASVASLSVARLSGCSTWGEHAEYTKAEMAKAKQNQSRKKTDIVSENFKSGVSVILVSPFKQVYRMIYFKGYSKDKRQKYCQNTRNSSDRLRWLLMAILFHQHLWQKAKTKATPYQLV